VNVQKVVSAVVGLVIVVGGFGCRQIARNASDDVADRVADRAVEQSYDWSGPDIDTGDDSTDIGSGADVPEGWPADLGLVEDLDVLYTTADALGLNVTGNVDGDLAATARAIEMDLVDAGFTVDNEVTADQGDGRSSTVVTATGPEHTATVTLTETPQDPHGALTIVYLLVPTAG
jgi:hypothetical protein